MSKHPTSAISHPLSTGDGPKRLPTPVRITEQTWPEGTVPVVSIFCITYNHEKFIRDAIEGFLMQETTFPVEIFIHDDASTDGTTEIIKEYAQKYPQLFRMVLQSENQYARKRFAFLFEYLSRQRGEFIAFCEGDDYWMSLSKLQKQVEILESDSTASVVFHNAWVKHTRSCHDYFQNRGLVGARFHLEEIIEREWFMATASLLFRRPPSVPAEIARYSMCGDMLLQIALCTIGDAVYLDEVNSVYRRHSQGASNDWHNAGHVHYEKMRPNNVWMYWCLSQSFLPPKCKQVVERRVRDLLRGILTYAVASKDASLARSRERVRDYLLQLIVQGKPGFVPASVVEPGGRMREIVEAETDLFWQKHRTKQRVAWVKSHLRKLARWC